MFATDTIVL